MFVQKYTHVRQSQRGTKPYYTSRLWWCGILLMGLGELGNFAAYGFAPASLIAPLGCVSVIGKTLSSSSPSRVWRLQVCSVSIYSLTDVQKHVKLVLFVSLSASAVISVVFLKETLRASDILGEIRVLLTSHSEALVKVFPNLLLLYRKIIKIKLYYIYIYILSKTWELLLLYRH